LKTLIIEILEKAYLDTLITSLVHQGYSVYLDYNNNLCVEIADDEVADKKV
jgi:hypothetical protein